MSKKFVRETTESIYRTLKAQKSNIGVLLDHKGNWLKTNSMHVSYARSLCRMIYKFKVSRAYNIV